MLKAYLKSLSEVASTGDAREESYYSTLESLLSSYAKSIGKNDIHIRTLPKKTEAGNPDFRVWDGNLHIVGYVEAKVPATEDLDQTEESEQLQRYRHTFPNLLLTNFLEFRFYRDGDLVDKVVIGRPFVMHKLGKMPPIQNEPQFLDILEKFFSYSLPKVTDAKTLAVELAKRTRFLRDVVAEQLREEERQEQGVLLGFYEAFRKYLIGRLTPDDFANLYAQTVTYGLFAARTRARNGFSRRLAFDHIPRTVGILRDVFQFISLGDPPKQVEWIVDDISEVLAVADAGGILDRYYHEGKGSDPIVHFYETFLAEYDPEERERRGVYYTPEPVVSYIVRSLHGLLKREFGITDGLASEGVTLLDPAAGTMTFVARACQEAVQEFERKYGAGGREEFICKHLLKDYYAFELMMAPYAVGHLKMSFFLEELGHRLRDDERFHLYLTNALEMAELEQTHLPGMASLAEESHLAGEVKKQRPILVLLGNPPYSGHSANLSEREIEIKKGHPYVRRYTIESHDGRAVLVPEQALSKRDTVIKQKTWIGRLIEDYKVVDGHWLEEKNPKWLQDDYVKFVRFAQWKIDEEGRGAVGMITNHSYLDNPTFRGMRLSLMRSFDEIYVLDLHGNYLKREISPDGSKDENVFDIRQGVAVVFLIKKGDEKGDLAKVHHAEIWGLREGKYDYLLNRDVRTTGWQEIHPKPDSYLFVPRDEAALGLYDTFIRVTDIFPVHSVGIVTARDKLTIHWTPEDAWRTVVTFSGMAPELAREAYGLGKDARDWKVSLAQKDLKDSGPDRGKVVAILYRPFDVRYTYYTGNSRGFHCRPRPEVTQHMLAGGNVGLILPRRVELSGGWHHALVTNLPVEHVAVSLKTIDYLFPLYLYPGSPENDRPGHLGLQQRQPNLNPAVLARLRTAYGREPSPEAMFRYVYAVLHAKTYREKYADFLRRGFPQVPLTADSEIFEAIAEVGKRLADLHLLRSRDLDPPAARFEGESDNRVARTGTHGLRYEPKDERVYVNETQYFEPVPVKLWEYQIGGYQVLEKWLKDRRDRQLSLDEIKTYCRVVTAIALTIALQEEIGALYPEIEKATIPGLGPIK